MEAEVGGLIGGLLMEMSTVVVHSLTPYTGTARAGVSAPARAARCLKQESLVVRCVSVPQKPVSPRDQIHLGSPWSSGRQQQGRAAVSPAHCAHFPGGFVSLVRLPIDCARGAPNGQVVQVACCPPSPPGTLIGVPCISSAARTSSTDHAKMCPGSLPTFQVIYRSRVKRNAEVY